MEDKTVQTPPEEVKIEEKGEKLDINKVAIYAAQLEGRLKDAAERIKVMSAKMHELEDQLAFYQMQDYYQRAQLLCVIVSNDAFDPELRAKCAEELAQHVYPSPKKEEEHKE